MRRTLEWTAVAAAIGLAFLPSPAQTVERVFSTGFYPVLQRALTPLTNRVPFALLDLLIAGGVLIVLAVLVRGLREAWRRRHLRPLVPMLGHLAALAAVGYVIFLVVWGFNYRRVPMTDRVALDPAAPTAAAVIQLGLQAAAGMNRLHADAHRIGWSGDEWRDASLRRAFDVVQRTLSDSPPAEPGRLKSTLLGAYFRGAGVDGMINPFGLEVLVNPDLLPFERPFVAAHEWAHLAGYADESEASFVGWLTCLRGDVPAQYSAWLFLYWQVSGGVGGAERTALAATLEDGPRRDLEAVADRIRRGQWPALRMAGWAVYDEYLKANRVDAGVRSYDLVLTLILRTRFDAGWTPVRRSAVTP